MAKPASASTGMSRPAVKRRIAFLVVLLVIAGSIAYPQPANVAIAKVNSMFGWHVPPINKPFVLGLDLQGGTSLEYQADVSRIAPADQQSAVDGVRDVIERRVNAMGVSEPVVTTAKAGNEYRVSVELAGVRDINQAIKMIGETPILEFKEQNTDAPRKLTTDEQKKMDTDNAAADKAAKDALAQALKDPSKFQDLVMTTTQMDSTKLNGGDLGFIKDNQAYQPIYDAVKGDAAGTVHPSVVTMPNYDVVAKVEEVKSAGTEINASHILIQFAGATGSSSTSTRDQALAEIKTIQKQVTVANFADMAKKYSQEPGAAQSGGSLGWFGKGVMVQQFEDAAFKLQKGQISDVVETPFGFHLIYKSDERPLNDVHVRATFFKKTTETDILGVQDQWKNTQLTGKNLKQAALAFDQQTGNSQVSLTFDSEGTKLFGEITKRNIGKPVAIFLDGQAISVPTVQAEITGGQAVITGNFTIQEAKLLAQRLNAGALPVPITLISQQSVGPTLGQDSVDASLIAGLWGFLLVAFFMLAFYRLPGFLAITTLGLYVAISAAIFKLIPVTMSLSGIAGFILSIGIAVDANVLVFERLKEELRAGKPLKTALEEAFKRAWPSIRDGNMTTLISCAVLYWFSSSVIKGFALTLAVGVLLSMFSAVVAARAVLRFVAGFAPIQKAMWLFPGGKNNSQS